MQLPLSGNPPCKYFVREVRRDDYGNTTWDDGCMESCPGSDYSDHYHPCHVANGWMNKENLCLGWSFIKTLCQVEAGRRFLYQYLRLNHARESPMPIPQAHVNSEESIRVDFALFVLMTTFEWKWLAVEIDREDYYLKCQRENDVRDHALTALGFEIIRLSRGVPMLDNARKLHSRVNEIKSSAGETA